MINSSSWTKDIDDILDNIRKNCLLLCKAHKKRYFENQNRLKWYRLPVIILNGCNSIISVGLQPYATQGAISLTTSLIALTCGIIGSIELYLGIQKRLESDLISQRDYNRPVPAKDYLEKTYNIYTKLIESSDTLVKKIDDSLIPINLETDDIKIITPSENGSINLSNGRFDTNIDD